MLLLLVLLAFLATLWLAIDARLQAAPEMPLSLAPGGVRSRPSVEAEAKHSHREPPAAPPLRTNPAGMARVRRGLSTAPWSSLSQATNDCHSV